MCGGRCPRVRTRQHISFASKKVAASGVEKGEGEEFNHRRSRYKSFFPGEHMENKACANFKLGERDRGGNWRLDGNTSCNSRIRRYLVVGATASKRMAQRKTRLILTSIEQILRRSCEELFSKSRLEQFRTIRNKLLRLEFQDDQEYF